MPAVSNLWRPEGDLAVVLGGSGPVSARASTSALREEGACRCGRRRPVGVLLGLRSGARPKLHGQWFCRKQCLLEALQERARRDFAEGTPTTSRVRHRVPLGLLLQARGVVSAAQLQEALRVQKATGLRLGAVLHTHFQVSEERITEAVAAQWGLPMLHLPDSPGVPKRSLAPARLFHASGAFPVEQTAERLLLACSEGPDPALALALERMYPLRVEFGVISSASLEVQHASFAEGLVPVQRIRCLNRGSLVAEVTELLSRLQPVDARVVRVNGLWWLRMWLEEAARRNDVAGQDAAAQGTDTMDVLYSLASESSAARHGNA